MSPASRYPEPLSANGSYNAPQTFHASHATRPTAQAVVIQFSKRRVRLRRRVSSPVQSYGDRYIRCCPQFLRRHERVQIWRCAARLPSIIRSRFLSHHLRLFSLCRSRFSSRHLRSRSLACARCSSVNFLAGVGFSPLMGWCLRSTSGAARLRLLVNN
jgi:hypothetical protein